MRNWTRLYAFLISVAIAGSLSAQDDWKSKHHLKNRYEGLIDIPTGNPPLEVLSFTAKVVPFEKKEEWRVRYFSHAQGTVTVYGRDVDDDIPYWMESEPQSVTPNRWSQFLGWNTGDVLLREGVSPDSVGVTVLSNSADRAYLPAIVYPASKSIESLTKSFPLIQYYTLSFRTNRTINRLVYTISGVRQGRSAPPERQSLKGEHVAGAPIVLQLDVKNYADGPMSVVIQAIKDEHVVSSKQIDFYHHGSPVD
jgi:hypothetical protein